MKYELMALCVGGILCLAGVCHAAETATATMTIQADKPGPKISPTLFGIFFEEINCSGDGGLYAELIRNRSFEEADEPNFWFLPPASADKSEMTVDQERPLSEKNPRSLKWTIRPGADGAVTVVNQGYWGMGTERGAEYALSFYARCDAPSDGRLTAALRSEDGKELAKAEIAGIGPGWKRFETSLKSDATDPKAQFAFIAGKPGTFWLDVVSLFPKKTFRDRSNGLRPDLAKMLEDLHPAFMRFPGGCWVEGDTLEFAQRWKQTIGDIADRRTQFNIWQYYATNGLGYHEYLQLCEDLGAEPLFVINCGMSHKENVPMDKMAEWVQDALDAVEYANGPADSVWGAQRAKNGHPAPFNLKYMEIGNENGGPAYQERYALFYDALRARYPEIKLVADQPTEQRPADIVDEHYYSSPEFFVQNAHKYDNYDRKGPRIYVGEYAVTQRCGQGNLAGALGEAAFMTGLERNADVVVMASYAPLFVNINHRKWNPNLIDFDSARVYGIPSYYVQKLFSDHRADVVLPLTLEADVPTPAEEHRGGIGVGTWSTKAEFKDIRVTQGDKVLFESDFSQGIGNWHSMRGQWEVRGAALAQTDTKETDCRALAGNRGWTDYTYSLKARKTEGAEGFLILFHAKDDKNWVWWNLGGWGNVRHGLEGCQNGAKCALGDSVPGSIETGRWYDLRVEVQGQRIRCYLDGQLVHDVEYPRMTPLHAVAGRIDKSGDLVVKTVNVADVPIDAALELYGAPPIESTATAYVLTSADPRDENSIDEPTKVAPVTQSISNAGPKFHHTFPPHSLTILRMKTR